MLAMAVAMPSVARADTVYNNGAPNGANIFPIDGTRQVADDFTLATTTDVTGATFTNVYETAIGQPTLPLNYYIYSGAQPSTGNLIDSGIAQNVVIGPGGSGSYGPGYAGQTVSFSFETPFQAAANTQYWFGLNYPTAIGTHWEVTNANATSGAYSSNDDFATVVTATGQQLSFSLQSAAPEPASWAMMIGGFGIVGGAMRRRRASGGLSREVAV
ncbi:PEPxxWA-CTERM sorting domain-containing protein [Sphingomonas immobilis]|uniref:PEPxxWA-CTERM sorting domain-containing protein n=1 Tax=Sphingomonas immobilis TaxID=3063997 RepID=A0ABT8ZYP5_9SPHN|nr:PEPxxWA-CTERM sorting domain-containing protein [Sphingomonas sp. CA1-15]MDO7842701.1 PEPxxWA-CTERM sorting domain-containing protein [Sphingomonas sp. CA1-15]